ncbi:MAG TPA: carboxyl transferase domain-containing protein [Pilimelia sp.]|nr:carboxyl transferase domain-containing protein [Pilimelia sp.]
MAILDTAVDPRAAWNLTNRAAMLDGLAELDGALDAARAGGGERDVTRHHARGKLLPRERIELLVDQDSPFLELSPVAGWGTDSPTGAGLVTGIGVVENVECVLIADDPTVRGTAGNPYAAGKAARAGEIALANRLPLITLVENGEDAPPYDGDPCGGRGAVPRDLARLSAARVPTVSAVFGGATGAHALVPALSDFTVLVRNQARVFLAGPARGAGGEEAVGGAAMHAGRSGLADFIAEDERDGLRIVRQCVRRLNWHKQGPPPRDTFPAPPRHSVEDLLAVPGADPGAPLDPREILGRVLDGSEFDEFKPAYGPALVAGWGGLHGYPVAVLATGRGPVDSAEAQKGAHFVQLANAAATPLLHVEHAGRYAGGADAAQRGLVKHGAMLVNAIATAGVPQLVVTVGDPDDATARAWDPRFRFSWPSADGRALARSGRLGDDGVIDPRDTRTVLGLCLSALHTAPVGGPGGFGVFRL